MKNIIMSRGRADKIVTHNLLSNFILYVPEGEKSLYEKAVSCDIKTYPDDVAGIGSVRNYILEKEKDEIIFWDDDIRQICSVCRARAYPIVDKEEVEAVMENVYCNAKEAGVTLFSLNQKGCDPRKYHPSNPFGLVGFVGTIVGVLDPSFRFIEYNKSRVDVDASLQCLLKDRIIWIDNRFAFACKRDTNTGGSNLYKDKETLENEKRRVENKWGKYVKFLKGKQRDGVRILVKRQHPDVDI